MNRRDALAATLGGAAALTAGGCTTISRRFAPPRDKPPLDEPPLPPRGEVAPTVRLLNRAGFGPVPGDVAKVEAMGAHEWLDHQFSAPPDDSDETTGLRLRLGSLEALQATNSYDLLDYRLEEVLRQLQQAAILRATYSQWQLRERMVDFWSNHFNIYARKNLGTFLTPANDAQVIRAHALGRFPDLLAATAHSPAMLGYLDNQQNRKGVANENYARELMELHTLGIGGGYAQKDVQEVARCLTGWTVEDRFLRRKGTFRFDESRHDDGPKTVLGHEIGPGGGESDGVRVLQIVSEHPSTARFIARKLTRYFVGTDEAASPLVGEVAAAYRKSGGSIPAMLRAIFNAPAFYAAPLVLKRPFDFLVSALRVTDADTDGGASVQHHLAQMGQPLFQWPMPDGYPDRTSAWTGSLLHRWNFAAALAGQQIKGTTLAALPTHRSHDDWIATVLSRRANEAELASARAALSQFARTPQEVVALLLASPEFQWR